MRVTGGRLRGRGLAAPATRAVRPTADRLREALFNVLEHRFGQACAGARVIDLFAGTGALGLEALSRGAAFALFVDEGAEALACLAKNVEALGVAKVARVVRRDATRLGAASGEPFTLAFLDPPYNRDLAAPALAALHGGGWLGNDALCIVEEARGAPFAPLPCFVPEDERIQGDTSLRVLRYRPGGARVDSAAAAH